MEFLVAFVAFVSSVFVVVVHVHLQITLLGETLRALITN